MKNYFLCAVGVIGGAISYFVGGFDQMLICLCLLMVVDYIGGVLVATVFHNSPKTESGTLSSAVGFKGIFKKLFTLILVGVSNQLDIALGINFVRSAFVTAFIANEVISIVENTGLMGIPIPKAIEQVIDILNGRGEANETGN